MGDGLISARQCGKPTRREAVGTACEIRLIRQAPMRAAGLAGRIAPRRGARVASAAGPPAPDIAPLIRATGPARWLIGLAGLKLAVLIRQSPVTLMLLSRLPVVLAASLAFSSASIAQPAPAPVRPAAVQPRPPAAGVPGQPAAQGPLAPCGSLSQRHVVRPFPRRPQAAGGGGGRVAARADRGCALPRLRPKHRQPRPRPARIRPGVHRILTKPGVRRCGKKCAGESPDACGGVRARGKGIWRAAGGDRRVLGAGEQFWRRAGQAAYAAVAGVAGV